ncbi:ATP-binding protein, partial [bacterium]|nr:ATP-binding protein [bacterium]
SKNKFNNNKIPEIKIDENTPHILADRDKFQQIMTNLIENACKYGDENSVITIKSFYTEENVSISVINQGLEISKDDFEKIFTKFSRIDNPLTRKVQGSGLGLYITKNLVEKMGGKISVKSENHQTIFEVVLPCANIERQAKNAVSYSDN